MLSGRRAKSCIYCLPRTRADNLFAYAPYVSFALFRKFGFCTLTRHILYLPPLDTCKPGLEYSAERRIFFPLAPSAIILACSFSIYKLAGNAHRL
ncbi:hypothetical protein CEXT_169701 [Caerostris extrusa]|uniref:Uncharacterized protein n=1 Tax=Caerostris extrusa TaxID=172846 RepID=A0AAV4XHQ0_CAEEX|nr:hypothetical protein CEXT_169701 [Caerostris extrusa]